MVNERGKHPSLAIEAADFLIGQPSFEEIAAYRASEEVQAYLDYLLERNGEDELTRDEFFDLHQMIGIISVLDLLKVQAKLKLKQQADSSKG